MVKYKNADNPDIRPREHLGEINAHNAKKYRVDTILCDLCSAFLM